ncbi:hypothetical protein HY798_03390 [Candidatus Falkowbacteria bacterium]|nr:hypothetical protein [Candidatus Falkowbacteria bacterium]
MNENPNFLKKKYDLHNAPEVEAAAKRAEKRTGEKVSQNPEERIQNYIDRFKEIIERKEPAKRERGIKALKKVLHDKFIIKAEAEPESAFLLEQRIAREQEYGDVEITDEFKEQKTAQIINNQTRSLDKWINYLSSSDARYSDWAKYWAFRSMIEMGKLQKEEDENGKETARFKKRTKDTVVSFPPLNPRALALTIGALRSKLEEKAKPKEERKSVKNQSVKLNDEEFQRLLSTENFSKIYAQFLIEMPEYSTEKLQEIRGKWIKYEKNSDAHRLVESLEGYPLEWCTADYDTARGQLQGGDFHVYYSINESGEAIIPRLAIRMQNDQIAEDPRGIAPDQNMDPYIVPVLEEKLKEFGSQGEAYKKKSTDMKFLTGIERKTKVGQELAKNELIFLYEIDSTIEGFGYQRDPRIKELRAQRNPEEDALVVFECSKEQIAGSVSDLKNKIKASVKIKAYVGELEEEIFKILPENVEYVYTNFPEGKIKFKNIILGSGPKTANEFERGIKSEGHKISDWAKDILKKINFENIKEKTEAELIILSAASLGFKNGATMQEIYEKAKKLGLELCPAEVGPEFRLQYKKDEQSKGEYLFIGMEPMGGSGGRLRICRVSRDDGGEGWLITDSGSPSDRWSAGDQWVFVRRKYLKS